MKNSPATRITWCVGCIFGLANLMIVGCQGDGDGSNHLPPVQDRADADSDGISATDRSLITHGDPVVASEVPVVRPINIEQPSKGAGIALVAKSPNFEAPASAEELKKYVTHLARTIGERNLAHYEELRMAADYIEKRLVRFGYSVSRQTFQVSGLDCQNVIAERQGQTQSDEIFVIGAHYDSIQGSPGANDNGSGVASMLALARMFGDSKLDRTIRFVGFTNEEPPYFQTKGEMGSWVYARKCRRRNDNIVGVMSLETMGYFSEKKNSQKYPPPMNLLHPSTGNFIGFVGDTKSRELVGRAIKVFRDNSEVPSEWASLSSAINGVGWSDHWSFWQEGYVGFMVTDTAPFRYPHYHKASDTPDKVDFETLTKVVNGLETVVQDLATVVTVIPKPGKK